MGRWVGDKVGERMGRWVGDKVGERMCHTRGKGCVIHVEKDVSYTWKRMCYRKDMP